MSLFNQYLICKSCRGDNFRFYNEKAQCLSCGGAYEFKKGVVYTTDAAPSVGSKYARQSARKNWSKWRQSNYEFLKEKLRGFSNETIVVDLGCGESPFGDLMERFTTCLRVDFTDYDGVNIVSNLNENLPIKSDSMDIVISSNTLEHLPNTEDFLNECNRILKPGGVLVATVPFLIPLHQEPFDFLRFTKYQLEYLLRKTRFIDIKVQPLSDFYEVYQSIQNDFLNSLVSQQASTFSRALMKLLRKSYKLGNVMFRDYFDKVKDDRYHKGYGFVAIKS